MPVAVRGSIDVPRPGERLRFLDILSGWALIGSEPPGAVEVIVNGTRRFPATVGTARPDVAAYFGDSSLPTACGWWAAVDLSTVAPGTLSIDAVARPELHLRTGARTVRAGPGTVIASRTFELSDDAVIGNVDTPTVRNSGDGDVVTVRGWAWARDPLEAVEVELDGHPLGRAHLGLPRPEVHESMGGLITPAVGFELQAVLGSGAGANGSGDDPEAHRRAGATPRSVDVSVRVVFGGGRRHHLGTVPVVPGERTGDRPRPAP